MRYLVLVMAASSIVACAESVTDPPAIEALRVVEIAGGLTNPLYLTVPPGDNRLFVVEQEGRIRVIRDNTLLDQPFLDIANAVNFIGEGGLLGLAFSPDYETTGHFWINYTDRDDYATVIERYTVSADPDMADPTSARLVLRVDQPTTSHNGGQLTFGPDGMLYVGMGDGGEYEDPDGHAQNASTLLGGLLRIDVRSADPYAIPADNPFHSSVDGRPEVWAIGLRNPWRFSFDAVAGSLFVTDVGQHMWEEINAVPASAPAVNYGWSLMEGTHCFNAVVCDPEDMAQPVHEYPHSVGCSIIGGYVYRGEVLTGLQGHYFYGDYCQGWVRSLRVENGVATDHRDWNLGHIGHILSFGQDAAGELYVVSTLGSVYRIEPE
jgi:hypothetical protein